MISIDTNILLYAQNADCPEHELALSLQHHGVTELATANVKDFEGLGFERVWNPAA